MKIHGGAERECEERNDDRHINAYRLWPSATRNDAMASAPSVFEPVTLEIPLLSGLRFRNTIGRSIFLHSSAKLEETDVDTVTTASTREWRTSSRIGSEETVELDVNKRIL